MTKPIVHVTGAKAIPGIFGSPQPSQVKPGSIPMPPCSRMNRDDAPSRFIKITPAFACQPERKEDSRADVQRSLGPERAAAALKKIRNRA